MRCLSARLALLGLLLAGGPAPSEHRLEQLRYVSWPSTEWDQFVDMRFTEQPAQTLPAGKYTPPPVQPLSLLAWLDHQEPSYPNQLSQTPIWITLDNYLQFGLGHAIRPAELQLVCFTIRQLYWVVFFALIDFLVDKWAPFRARLQRFAELRQLQNWAQPASAATVFKIKVDENLAMIGRTMVSTLFDLVRPLQPLCDVTFADPGHPEDSQLAAEQLNSVLRYLVIGVQTQLVGVQLQPQFVRLTNLVARSSEAFRPFFTFGGGACEWLVVKPENVPMLVHLVDALRQAPAAPVDLSHSWAVLAAVQFVEGMRTIHTRQMYLPFMEGDLDCATFVKELFYPLDKVNPMESYSGRMSETLDQSWTTACQQIVSTWNVETLFGPLSRKGLKMSFLFDRAPTPAAATLLRSPWAALANVLFDDCDVFVKADGSLVQPLDAGSVKPLVDAGMRFERLRLVWRYDHEAAKLLQATLVEYVYRCASVERAAGQLLFGLLRWLATQAARLGADLLRLPALNHVYALAYEKVAPLRGDLASLVGLGSTINEIVALNEQIAMGAGSAPGAYAAWSSALLSRLCSLFERMRVAIGAEILS